MSWHPSPECSGRGGDCSQGQFEFKHYMAAIRSSRARPNEVATLQHSYALPIEQQQHAILASNRARIPLFAIWQLTIYVPARLGSLDKPSAPFALCAGTLTSASLEQLQLPRWIWQKAIRSTSSSNLVKGGLWFAYFAYCFIKNFTVMLIKFAAATAARLPHCSRQSKLPSPGPEKTFLLNKRFRPSAK